MGDETGAEGGGFGAADEDDETADGRRADVLLNYTAPLGLGDGKGRIVCRLGERGCFFCRWFFARLSMALVFSVVLPRNCKHSPSQQDA